LRSIAVDTIPFSAKVLAKELGHLITEPFVLALEGASLLEKHVNVGLVAHAHAVSTMLGYA
jgi:hypothetical protein